VLIARLLPDAVVFSESHAWWHNILLGIVWLGLYGYLGRKYYNLASGLIGRLTANERFKIFPFWHWLCYISAALIIPAANYFAWPDAAKLIMIPLIAIPLVYLLVHGGAGSPLLLLRQLCVVLLVAFGCVFFVIPMIVFLVLAFLGGGLLGAAANGGGSGSGDMVCPRCGAAISRGTTCPCGYSHAAWG
jgi:hypothetical protein